MEKLIGIIDYGAGNFASVKNAFDWHGVRTIAIKEPALIGSCSHIVLPGVGAFSTAVDSLNSMGLVHPLQQVVRDGDIPFLGICVGMQLLAEGGTEFIETEGLGAVSGSVRRFDFSSAETLILPHIGWNSIEFDSDSILFQGIDKSDTDFYFIHSYHLVSTDALANFSYSNYGYQFISAIEKKKTFGVQFHPEKSQRNGRQLIANFLEVERA